MPLSPKQIREHQIQFNTMLRLESGLRLRLSKARNRYIDEAAALFVTTGEAASTGTRPFNKFREEVQDILSDKYREVIPAFGRRVERRVQGQKSHRLYEVKQADLWANLSQLWIEQNLLRASSLITDTANSDIQRAVERGIEEGQGTQAIASTIRQSTGLSAFRSSVIARTEVHNAANFASIETSRAIQQEAGFVMHKKWLAAVDERTRVDHREMNNKKSIPIDGQFRVGPDLMDRPGDTSASAGNVINCRCVLDYGAEEDF